MTSKSYQEYWCFGEVLAIFFLFIIFFYTPRGIEVRIKKLSGFRTNMLKNSI